MGDSGDNRKKMIVYYKRQTKNPPKRLAGSKRINF
jgi:hypothetical protein